LAGAPKISHSKGSALMKTKIYGSGIIGAVAALSMLTLSGNAFAGNAGDGSGYGTQPGFTTAITNSNGCAGHGAFGAFGADYNFGNSTSGRVLGAPGNDQNGNGANGQQTGINNSTLCGNPQNNLP
jgi:hypothetical protein